MRILLDLQSCQSGSRLGGIGRYSLELAKAICRRPTEHEFWICANQTLGGPIADIRYEFANLLPQDRIRVYDLPRGVAELTNHEGRVRAAEAIREEFVRIVKPDMLHITSLFEGLLEEVVTSVGTIFPAERTAVTLYDLIPYVQADRYLADKAAREHYLKKIDHLKQAGLLLAISEFSKLEAEQVLSILPERIVNISSAADAKFYPREVSLEEAAGIRRTYGLSRNFLMYTGSFDQRKNHSNLIRGYALLPEAIRKQHQLMIVGNGWPAIYQQLNELAATLGLGKDELVFAGHVTDSDLPLLYNLCSLFVFPSLAEGFGLPVLEAMSCGTPTIASNCTSLPEVLGWSAAEFDPTSPASIAKAIERPLSDAEFAAELVDRGLRQSKLFSWDKSASKAIAAFEQQHDRASKRARPTYSASNESEKPRADSRSEILDAFASIKSLHDLSEEALQELAYCVAMNKYQADVISSQSERLVSTLRVGWISTWHTKCGIAAYSKFLLDHIPADVKIYAPAAEWLTAADDSRVTRCWKQDSDDNLRQLEDTITRDRPDIVVLQFNYGFYNFDALNRLLLDVTGEGIKVCVIFHSTHDPFESKRMVMLINGLSACSALFVHANSDVKTLRKLGLNNVHFIPQGVMESPSSAHGPVRQQATIATYGFALPHKGLPEIVDAFAAMPRTHRDHLKLLMLNAEYPNPVSAKVLDQIRSRIEFHQLASQIELQSSYTTDADTVAKLGAVDLVVFPYQVTGESSSAAVRMGMASGRPVAVTPLSIFDDVGDGVFKLPGCSASEMSSGLVEVVDLLRQDDEPARSVSRSAAIWRSAHSMASISNYLHWSLLRCVRGRTGDVTIAAQFTLSAKSPKLDLRTTERPMKTVVGQSKAGKLSTSARAGHLLFGPFLSVAPGSYRAQLVGTRATSGNCVADVVMDGAKVVLAYEQVTEWVGMEVMCNLNFTVPKPGCSDLEVRVVVDDQSDFSLSKIALERMGD